METVREMITCGACHEVAVPAPVFVGDDGERLNSVEVACTKCGQLWQFPNYPPATIRGRRFGPEEGEPPEPTGFRGGVKT